MWYLEETTAEKKRFGPITDAFVIGRNPKANLILRYLNISRQHCILLIKNESLCVQDLGSSNGIFINGAKLSSKTDCILKVGDILGVGEFDQTNEISGGSCLFKVVKEDETMEITTNVNANKRPAGWETNSEIPNKKRQVDCCDKQNASTNCPTSSTANQEYKAVIINEDDQNVDILPGQSTNKNYAPAVSVSNNDNEILRTETKCVIISDDDDSIDISPISRRIAHKDIKTEIISEDDDSVDMFSENPYSNASNQMQQNITVLSLLDSDDEHCSEINDVLIKQEIDNKLVPDDYITISSSDEEEENPWLEKLSQRSTHSPPPEKNNWYADEDQWWPELSQSILEEFEREKQDKHTISQMETIRHVDNIDGNLKTDSKKGGMDERDSNKHQILDTATNDKLQNLVKKVSSTKSLKPVIIEAPIMLKQVKIRTKKKVEKKTPVKEKKTPVKDKRAPNLDKRRKSDSKRKEEKKPKSSEEIKSRDVRHEIRKKRLKELAEQGSGSKENHHNDKKEKTKPKVKCTSTNRSDMFTAEILKKVDKPATLKSTDGKKSLRNKTEENVPEKIKSKNEMVQDPSKEKKFESQANDNNLKEKTKPDKDLLEIRTSKRETIKDSSKEKKTDKNIAGPSHKVESEERPKPDQVATPSRTSSKIPRKPILKKSLVKSQLQKKVRFNLQPLIREFTKPLHETPPVQAPPMIGPNIREQRFLRNVLQNELFYEEDIIFEIVNWDVKSLLTPNNPSGLLKNLKQNSNVYNNFQDYYNTLKNLMLLELWALIQCEYNATVENNGLKRVFQVFIKGLNVFTERMQKNRKLFNLECQLLLTKQEDQKMNHPKIGEGVLLKITTVNSNGIQETNNRFGYVYSLRKNSINRSRNDLPQELISSVANPQILANLMILTKWDCNTIITDKCVLLRRVGRIGGVMKEFTALQKLPSSPLMPLILNPTNLQNINYHNIEQLGNLDFLNTEQKEVIYQVGGSCFKTKPTINLIQGPPGTGKSFVIVNLVMHLLYGMNRYYTCVNNRNALLRILICAPTNSAIDDLTLKLLEIRKKIPNPKHRFRMVRVGQTNKMHPTVQLISVQTLSERNANLNMYKENVGNPQLDNAKLQDHSKRIIEEELIIKRADIICTTLGSTYTAQLERLSKNPSFRFTTCIIDEATQCIEPAALLPLMLGIDSLVLVGDTRQLSATVKSQEAKKYGLGQSLFERIEKCFPKNQPCKNINWLRTQYRMNPEIVEFPNKHFYNSRLINGPNVYQYQFPLIAYQLFLHEFDQSSSEDNVKEAHIIVNMIKAILSLVNKVSIGIITPYHSQRSKILKLLDGINRENIVVNTVDGFQGQEKDIIIFSCVRTEGSGFLVDEQRLNVALTRARHSFYIVGNFKSLEMNPTWKALKTNAEHRKKIFYTKNIVISEEVFRKTLKNNNPT